MARTKLKSACQNKAYEYKILVPTYILFIIYYMMPVQR